MLISICLNGWVSNGYELSESACEESLVTLETVYKCPSNKTQYETAERRKNCSRYNHTTCKSFQYHCAFNENMTGLVEVCTTSRYILSGRCAEFNTGYKTIRDSYSTNCTGFDPPCPLYYNSTETYKYSDCYRMFEIETNTIGTAKKTFQINEVDYTLTTKIVLTISPAIVMITILILIMCFKVVYRVPIKKSLSVQC
ncbi:uncharacterized protein LOC130047749 isoform X2 [Ostrea edulis]|nr:uncharacterized protein LOC130047749 isoform X2 [Ostrea edulis]